MPGLSPDELVHQLQGVAEERAARWEAHYASGDATPHLQDWYAREIAVVEELLASEGALIDRTALVARRAHLQLQLDIELCNAKGDLDAFLATHIDGNPLRSIVDDLGLDTLAVEVSETRRATASLVADKAAAELRRCAELFSTVLASVRIDQFPCYEPGAGAHVAKTVPVFRKVLEGVDWQKKARISDFQLTSTRQMAIANSLLASWDIRKYQVKILDVPIPFWGLSHDTEFRSRSLVVLGQKTGLRRLSVLLHELGHCLENLTWKGDFLSFYTRPPSKREASAYVAQGLLERPDLMQEAFEECDQSAVRQVVLENKPRELAYLFVLMDLDAAIAEGRYSPEELSEVYVASAWEHFGFAPPSPYGYVKEQIHFLYPNYMWNYLFAEIVGWRMCEDLRSILDMKDAIRAVHSSDARVIEDLASARAKSLEDALV